MRFCCISVCFAAPGPVHGMGLVDLLGRLRSANLQIPESEPSHCLGSAGEVSASNMYTLLGMCVQFFIDFYFLKCLLALRVCE